MHTSASKNIPEKTEKKEQQMSEAFITAAFLSVSGGLQDAYTYIARGSVFANAQTGNIVLLSVNAFAGSWYSVLHYLVPLIAFAIGVAVAWFIRRGCQYFRHIHWRQLIVIMEILLLFAVGFIPESCNLLANSLVSFSCAMQVQAFRKVKSYAFSSTMCIGNIRSGMEALCGYTDSRDPKVLLKSMHYFGIIFLFALGAGIGSLLIYSLGLHTIWISCLLLSVSCLLMSM